MPNAPFPNFTWTALRPRQWTKNAIACAPVLFAFNFTPKTLLGSLLAFLLLCAAASGFYLINDIIDIEADRRHPVKRDRPIASGKIKLPVAIAIAAFLLTTALVISWGISPSLGATILGYILLQIAYNLWLKRAVILDVMAIAAGFVLRARAGAAATEIPLSPWFLLCTAMLALFLGIEKRKAELRLIDLKSEDKPETKITRPVLKRYSLTLLTRMETVVTTSTIIFYALWSSGPQLNGAKTSWMLLTLPFVLYGIFRYQLLSDPQEISRYRQNTPDLGGKSERPEEILLTDLPILITVSSWILTTWLILLLKQQGIIE